MAKRTSDAGQPYGEEIRLIRAREYKAAAARLSDHLARDDGDAEAWRLLAEAANGQRRFQRARKYIERALELAPDNRTYQYRYGQILRNCSDYRRAIPILEQVLASDPENTDCLDGLKVCTYYLGQVEKARAYGQRSILKKDKRARRRSKPLGSSPDRRAGSRQVIACSLWGTNPVYLYGAMINARLTRYFYPGWTSRIYIGADVPTAVTQDLAERGCEMVRATELYPGVSPYLWRFMVADDAELSAFMCRDCDSRPTVREVAAVAAWLGSGFGFHVLRDHVLHNDLVMGGLWGGRGGFDLDMKGRIARFQKRQPSRYYGHDQAFLENEIWPLIKDNCLAHDRFYRVNPHTKPFRTPTPEDESQHIGRCHNDVLAIRGELKALGIAELRGLPLRPRQRATAILSTKAAPRRDSSASDSLIDAD